MKGNKNSIKHLGTVTSVEGSIVRVRIMQSSACAGCHAAGLCQSSEAKEKVVEARQMASGSCAVGQQVMVEGSVRQGLKAVFYAYVLPIFLLLVVLVWCIEWGISESLSATLAIAALVPYYFVLYLLRNKLSQKFSFEVVQMAG